MTRVFVAAGLPALLLASLLTPDYAEAKAKISIQPIHITKPTVKSTPMLRGSAGNNMKGGRYLRATPTAVKKLPGKKKPPTLTLKRGKSAD